MMVKNVLNDGILVVKSFPEIIVRFKKGNNDAI